jgi:hypothetical protein
MLRIASVEMTEGIKATTWDCPYVEQRIGTGRMERRNIENPFPDRVEDRFHEDRYRI